MRRITDFMLIDKSSMGPEHDMWSLLDLSTCRMGTWDGQSVIYGKVYMVMDAADSSQREGFRRNTLYMVMDAADSCTSGPSFGYAFFSNGVYHTPGGSYQSIRGSNAYHAVKVIYDRANGSSSSESKSSSAEVRKVLPNEEIAIGGICPYTATPEYVRSIYGEPDKLSKGTDHSGHYYEHWTYGDSFDIWFWGNEGALVVQIVRTTAANGLAIPAGIKVGSRASEVEAKYGKSKSYWYKGSNDCNLSFEVKNGVVVSIGAGWND